jgi:hypothetical protein
VEILNFKPTVNNILTNKTMERKRTEISAPEDNVLRTKRGKSLTDATNGMNISAPKQLNFATYSKYLLTIFFL